jgi:hypothetical protein
LTLLEMVSMSKGFKLMRSMTWQEGDRGDIHSTAAEGQRYVPMGLCHNCVPVMIGSCPAVAKHSLPK